MIAHVGGVPVEENLPAALAGLSTGLAVVRVWVLPRLRRRWGRRK